MLRHFASKAPHQLLSFPEITDRQTDRHTHAHTRTSFRPSVHFIHFYWLSTALEQDLMILRSTREVRSLLKYVLQIKSGSHFLDLLTPKEIGYILYE